MSQTKAKPPNFMKNMKGLKLTFPKIPVYSTVPDYLDSKKCLDELEFCRHEWDKPGHYPVFHLLAGQRVLEHQEQKLAARRKWAENEYKKIHNQWEEIYELELELKNTFKGMSGFVKSIEEKLLRAEKAVVEDQKMNQKWSQEVDVLRKNISLILESQKELEEAVSELRLYEHYLNKAAGASETEFKNANDIIIRFEALLATKLELGERQAENLKGVETARARTAKMSEEYNFKILGLNNIIAQLTSRYNTAFREALHWENLVLKVKKSAYIKFEELTEVKQSCWNIYALMCGRKGETPKIKREDFERQLIYIKQTLVGFVDMQQKLLNEPKHMSTTK